MNASGINDEHNNATLVDNRSFLRHDDDDCAEPDQLPLVDALYKAAFYLALTVGIPGNSLSAIIWLRHGVAGRSSSAMYLAALAINDLAYLLTTLLYISDIIDHVRHGWLYDSSRYLAMSAATLEPLLVLGFSVERLIAILRPLQVRYLVYI